MGNKFDVYDFLLKNILKEQGDEEIDPQNPVQPNMVPGSQGQSVEAPPVPQDPQSAQEPTPVQAAQQVKPSVQTPFDQFTGASIKNIEFKPHENGGSVTLHTSLSPLPLVISWSGDRVTSKFRGITALT